MTLFGKLVEETQKNQKLTQELEELQPKADYFDHLVKTDLLVNFRTTAKELGVSPNLFTRFLLNQGYLFRNKAGVLYPYQTFVNRELFQVKEFCCNNFAGTQTLVTPKGRDFFRSLFQKIDPNELWELELEGGNI